MQTEETPDRRSEKPQTDHQFETPVVREDRPGRTADEERDDAGDGAEQPRPAKREMAFRHRRENVQTVFVARGRGELRPV
jgi:hypothetical protein